MNQIIRLKAVPKESNLYSAMEKIGNQQHYRKNEIIYIQDDEADTFYLLKSGRVRLFFTAVNGNELTVKILGAGQIFGDASYFSHTPRATSASAMTDVELLSVDMQSLLPYLTQHPSLIAELLNLMSQTIRLLSIQVYSMAFLSADKKVAHLLVQLGTYFKDKESDARYSIDYTHQELAELIGIARVTTTKELKRFEEHGWISLAYRHIQVLDETALKEYLLS
ncbi:Crp/Fnr family transcriptional regulator [Ammoniphilus sp. 3BR4]|uniref:Crp/Fnr family transcriptional regulator n=1 Tax=Ammoniphilus sp. 3BR4 TaxID=3158265 RepID=UPI0034651C67